MYCKARTAAINANIALKKWKSLPNNISLIFAGYAHMAKRHIHM